MKVESAITLCIALLLSTSNVSLAKGYEYGREIYFLKLGTYVADVTQTTKARSDGTTVTDNLKMKIKVISVEGERVKAQIVLNNEKGDVSGKVDSEGKLQLTGFLTHSMLPGEQEFRLTATVNENLVNGEYFKEDSRTISKGEFRIAVFEK
jgi:hypothetical protein